MYLVLFCILSLFILNWLVFNQKLFKMRMGDRFISKSNSYHLVISCFLLDPLSLRNRLESRLDVLGGFEAVADSG